MTKVWVIRAESDMPYPDIGPTRYLVRPATATSYPQWAWAPTPAVYVFRRRARAERVVAQLRKKIRWHVEAAEQDLEAWTAAALIATSRVE